MTHAVGMPAGCRSRRLLPTLLGGLGVILWASETTLITFTTAIPPIQTVALAFAAAGLLSPLLWWLTRTDPLAAFRQPARVWFVTVGALVGYHACIYYATQHAPPAAAALLQGTTPLLVVIGSAFLPSERLRWWHALGALIGFGGIMLLIDRGGADAVEYGNSRFYLAVIGVAAAMWGLYSVLSRLLPDVPSSALGVFYLAAALVSGAGHLALEAWVTPTPGEFAAIAALGILPMGIAVVLWDNGMKRGDLQALGAFANVEPLIGAVFAALFAGAAIGAELVWSGVLVICGATLASANLWFEWPPDPNR